MSDLRDQLKNRQEASIAKNDKQFVPTTFSIPAGVEMYKPRAGTNKLDIIPFIDRNGEMQYVLEYCQHIGVGVDNSREICIAKPPYKKACPICEHRSKEMAAGRKWDEPDIKALSPKYRCMYNVIDLLEPEKGIQIFEVSQFLFQKPMNEDLKEYNESEDEEIIFADLEDGRTVVFKGRETEFNGRSSVNKFDSFSFVERKKPYAKTKIKEAIQLDSLLTPKSYDELAALFFAIPSDDEDDEDQEREETDYSDVPFPESRTEDQQEAPEEPEPPRKKSGAKKTAAITCPVGLKFGQDFDGYVDCDDCEHRQACSDAQ